MQPGGSVVISIFGAGCSRSSDCRQACPAGHSHGFGFAPRRTIRLCERCHDIAAIKAERPPSKRLRRSIAGAVRFFETPSSVVKKKPRPQWAAALCQVEDSAPLGALRTKLSKSAVRDHVNQHDVETVDRRASQVAPRAAYSGQTLARHAPTCGQVVF